MNHKTKELVVAELSRQREWQKKQKDQGKCIMCGKKAIGNKPYCEEHLEYTRKYQRDRYRMKHGIPLDKPVTKRKNVDSTGSVIESAVVG